MKEYKDLVVGLDIGSSKVMVVVGEVAPGGGRRKVARVRHTAYSARFSAPARRNLRLDDPGSGNGRIADFIGLLQDAVRHAQSEPCGQGLGIMLDQNNGPASPSRQLWILVYTVVSIMTRPPQTGWPTTGGR